MEPEWIPLALVLAIHDLQLVEHGGLEGVRDANALHSALARPHHLLAYRPKASLFDLAAAYAVGIAKNHPFADGNKRTALVVSMTFLELNGIETHADEEDLALIFERVAEGKLNEKQLADWLEKHVPGAKKAPQRAK